MRRHRHVLALLIVLLALHPRLSDAQDSWLDAGREGWNTPGMAVPAAPGSDATDSSVCQEVSRSAETDEDAVVTAAGWRLTSASEREFGIALIGGFVGFDAMCRPVPYQWFVFVDGVFAGTLAPEPMVPRADGALTAAVIVAADRVRAVYARYAPTDPLCCPSGETEVTFLIDRTVDAQVVIPELDAAAATPNAAEPMPVCVNLGIGDDLSRVEWTAEEIAAHESLGETVGRPHPATDTCTDPAGLPVLRDFLGGFSWVCLKTADGDWYGPSWTADIYLPRDAVPPDPAIGGCPTPRDQSIPAPPDSELAAATAVYLSQLEAAGDYQTIYAWLHPDAQEIIPEEAVVGWYTADVRPRGPQPISIISVDVIQEWAWPVTGTGTPYPRAAEITYEQAFDDGSVVSEVMRLVPDDQGVWRWFFGRDRGFVDEQIKRFVDQDTAG